MNKTSLLLVVIPLCLIGCRPADKSSDKPPDRTAVKEAIIVEADEPVPFGYKCMWFAIQTNEPKSVVAALGLTDVTPCGWKKGIAAAYNGEAFVSPPVKGWVLVASFALGTIADTQRGDRFTPLMNALAKEFPDVQYFGTHRVVEYHGWARAVNGKVVRKHAFLGENGATLWDEGAPTVEEKKLALPTKILQEQDVFALAGAWSIDPTTLDMIPFEKGVGFLGSFPQKLMPSGKRT